jgi:phosphatidylglycerophosphate synthase
MRRLSPFVTWFIVNWTGLSADAVTGLAILSGIGAALSFLVAAPATYLLGILLLQLAYLLDTADGEVARVRGTSSRRGTYLDLIGHFLQNRTLLATTCFLFVQLSGYAWWAIAISFAGLAFESPFGVLSRMQVMGAPVDATELSHGRQSTTPWPAGGGAVERIGWVYRRLSFLWNYPASMNLFCLAAGADVIRFTLGNEGGPLALPLLAGAFAATVTVKQIANALRLLRRPLWDA